LKAKKPIIVTGGAGLIGSAIVWQLNQMGESNVIIVDHLGTSTKWQNLRALNFLDYMEKETFIAMVRDKSLPFTPATIFHLGACSSTTENDATYLINNNFLYTRDLATCALNHGGTPHLRLIGSNLWVTAFRATMTMRNNSTNCAP
jgi:ADP-L-glycero-D-manno-heptose 6-epimerase